MKQASSRSTRLPAAVLALGVTSLLTDVGTEMIFPLLPAFLLSLGAGPAFLGLIEGVADALSSLLKLGAGYAADRMPRKKPLVLFGYGLAAAVRPLVAFAGAPWHVLAVRMTDRVGKGVRSAPRDALIASSVPENEAGRAFGYHRAMDHAGAVLGPLLATALLALGLPLRHVFLVAFVPGLLAVLSILTVREPEAPPHTAAPSASGHLPPRLLKYLGVLLLFSLANSSDAFLLMRAKELGVSLASLPLLWASFHVSKVGSAYLGGNWSDRVPRVRLIAAGWLVYAATYLAFSRAREPWQIWLLFLVYGTYYGLTEPAEKALIKDLTPSELRGRAYGYYNFILGISAIPAGLLTGFLWEKWGGSGALGTGAAVALVASVLVTLV